MRTHPALALAPGHTAPKGSLEGLNLTEFSPLEVSPALLVPDHRISAGGKLGVTHNLLQHNYCTGEKTKAQETKDLLRITHVRCQAQCRTLKGHHALHTPPSSQVSSVVSSLNALCLEHKPFSSPSPRAQSLAPAASYTKPFLMPPSCWGSPVPLPCVFYCLYSCLLSI